MTHLNDDNKLLKAMEVSNLKGVSLEQIKEFVRLVDLNLNNEVDRQFIADQSNPESETEDIITSDYPDYTDIEKPFLDPNLYKVPKNEAAANAEVDFQWAKDWWR